MSAMPDSTLATSERLIADLQRQLAECRAERDEALRRETATTEVLDVINSSHGDLAPVFDAILEKALRLCEAVCGQLATYDQEAFEFVALKGDARWLQQRPRGRLPASRGLTWSRIVAGEPYVHILDALDTEAYRSGHEGARDAVISGGRTFLTVALRREQTLLGALAVYRKEARPFSDRQIALLQNFAAQAVIAMENARLLTETREALEQQTGTAEVLQVINSSPGDLAPVFDSMLEKGMRLCEAAFGVLWTLVGDAYRAAALRGVPPEFAEFVVNQRRGPEPDTALGQLASGESFVHVTDVTGRQTTSEIARKLEELGGIRTLLAAPLRKDGALLGAFHLYRQEVRPFTDKQIALLQNFAAQAVIAMENARLLDELRERTHELALRESELRESNDRYGLVSQAAAEGIYDWDISQNRLWVSARLIELFGWEEPDSGTGERPSQDWNARVYPEDFESYRAALRAALKGQTARLHCEYRIRLSNGDYRWVEDNAVPVRDGQGWAVRLVGAVSDVTDRKQGEQELREA
jgi:PAS domain S-box-containing protein